MLEIQLYQIFLPYDRGRSGYEITGAIDCLASYDSKVDAKLAMSARSFGRVFMRLNALPTVLITTNGSYGKAGLLT